MDKQEITLLAPGIAPGVARGLASVRARTIQDLTYSLVFTIPSDPGEPVTGREVIRFLAKDHAEPLVLDFTPGADHVKSVRAGGNPSGFRVVRDHILIPNEELLAGNNTIEIDFKAGDAALNRNPDFMYTLFVPARARTAFPCFDQPNLKGRFELELNIPADWNAVSNGEETSHDRAGDRARIRYAGTQPIPTYLFSFAAGKFQVETAERNGRRYRMFHRETDRAKTERNRNEVFDLHASSLDWLEKYTGIPYQFGKFDLVLIPSFQFGGMEHPGSIFYNASAVLLDDSATENQILNRASVIAHETAHMWFGDLVTMQWFNDVWMKEVFANFMAAKIVNPAFPRVNHDLLFLTRHYPSAYDVDRTAGTHPIRQELENLDEAGSLYDAIIYDKAPIVMRQLERILGPEKLQEGLQVYLKRFEFGNATWTDLIEILDERTERDLSSWSHAWVDAAGRPEVGTVRKPGGVTFIQTPKPERLLLWTEAMNVTIGEIGRVSSILVELDGSRTELDFLPDMPDPEFILPTGGGLAYGDFIIDERSRGFLLQHLPELKDALTRGAVWITLWEEMMQRRVKPLDLVNLALRSLPAEDTEQNLELVLGYTGQAFWTFLTDTQRQYVAPQLERLLMNGLQGTASSSTKATYFNAFRSTVSTPEGILFLERIWRREEKIPGLTLSEPDEASMALDLAVRSAPASAAILEGQRLRFGNPDRRARFEFVMPAVSDQEETRDTWFNSLRDVENRQHEPWVLEGLRYLHHPLRAQASERLLRPALEMLTEIQRTGDIFFPARWMDSTLRGHSTASASKIVVDFISGHPDYPVRLRRVILQTSDTLRRAAR